MMKIGSSGAVFLYIGLVIGSMPADACAEGWSLNEPGSQWGNFALGFASSIVAHEAGHFVVAKSKGYRVSHDGLTITYPGAKLTPADQLQLASAGFQTQWVLSEFALRDKNGREHSKPTGDFGAGVVSAYLGVSLAYLTFLKNQDQGDVYGMSNATGLSHDRIALMMAVPAVLDAWRLFGDDVPAWVPVVSVMSKGVGATWIWTY
jgi:hypothetical protein